VNGRENKMLKPELNWGLGSYLGMRPTGGLIFVIWYKQRPEWRGFNWAFVEGVFSLKGVVLS
jgi:hypothetical protein